MKASAFSTSLCLTFDLNSPHAPQTPRPMLDLCVCVFVRAHSQHAPFPECLQAIKQAMSRLTSVEQSGKPTLAQVPRTQHSGDQH